MNIEELQKKYEIATEFVAGTCCNANEEADSKGRDSQRANEALEIATKGIDLANEALDTANARLEEALETARKAATAASKADAACKFADDEAQTLDDFWESFNKDHYFKIEKQAKENTEKYGL